MEHHKVTSNTSPVCAADRLVGFPENIKLIQHFPEKFRVRTAGYETTPQSKGLNFEYKKDIN